jgi:hypothetical protein
MNVQKTYIKPMKQTISYYGGKQDIYLRAELEREKNKNIKKLTRKNELKLINKYWQSLKRFFWYKKLVKKSKLKLKFIAFQILKYNYLTNYQKYGDIIEKFDLKKKSMIFFMLYNEHIIQSKKRFLLKKKLVSSFNTFLDITRNQLDIKYNTYALNQKFYFNIFINKAFFISKENSKINNCISTVTNMQMNNAYFSVINFLKKKIYLKNNLYNIPRMNSYQNFFVNIRNLIQNKYDDIKNIFDFRLKFGFKSFISQIKLNIKQKNKISFVEQFYEEKLQRKAFFKLKGHCIILENFRELVINKLLYEKEKLKEKAGIEAYKKHNLVQKYREYKQNKLKPIKKSFFEKTKKLIEHKKMKIYVKEYSNKNLKKKFFIWIGKYAMKQKLFKIFLLKFQKVYKNNIKRDYINLMQYKVHKFLSPNDSQDLLPHTVGYFLIRKFNNQLINLKIFEMSLFYKKCKKIIIDKKKEKNKNLAADIFYSKLLKIKVFERFNLYMKYLQIKKLNNKNIQKKFLNGLKASMTLYQKEKEFNNKLRKVKGKNIYQKFFISLIIIGGANIYNNRKTSMKNIIINQILKNEEMYNDTNEINNIDEIDDIIQEKNKSDINNKLAMLILFKLIAFIIYRKLFNKLKVAFLAEKYKTHVVKKYLNQLNKANVNINAIKSKIDKIKNDVLNLNVNN